MAVCGGGNTALQDALFLSDLCRTVTVIHRRSAFRGDPILMNALHQRENIRFLLDTTIEALHGETALTGLSLRNSHTGEHRTLSVDGLFVAVGQQPDSRLADVLGMTDRHGFISADETCITTVDGIFAAGDCRTKTTRQLTTACADGAVASLAACQYHNA